MKTLGDVVAEFTAKAKEEEKRRYMNLPDDDPLKKEYFEEKVCCICGKKYIGFGNNPYPVADTGRCCDQCNSTYVITARYSNQKRRESKDEE